jgi:hypothetical protein
VITLARRRSGFGLIKTHQKRVATTPTERGSVSLIGSADVVEKLHFVPSPSYSTPAICWCLVLLP